jgi:adenylate cyclase class IV
MLVVDRDQPPTERDPAVVMCDPPIEATHWEVPDRETTLAEDNPEYPDDAQTIIVIYRNRFKGDDEYTVEVPEEVRSKLANQQPIPVTEVADVAKFYAFPAPRLEPTGEYWPSTESDEITDTEDEAGDAHIDSGATDASPDLESESETLAEVELKDQPAGDLDQLASVVQQAGFSGVQQVDDGVETTKLGETYRVDRNGTVVEGGAFADKLASVLEEQYDP